MLSPSCKPQGIAMKSFAACFADLPDPRAQNALHDLTELLFIALLSTLCGATNCSIWRC